MSLRRSIALTGIVLLLGCSPQPEPVSPSPAAPPFNNRATMLELMNWVFDVQADIVWAVGGTVVTEEGETRLVPKNDEEWNAVRNAAATIAEASNLLMLEGRARDHGDWLKYSRLVSDKANDCVAAAEAKDLDALFTAASDMYLACAACHGQYFTNDPVAPEEIPQ